MGSSTGETLCVGASLCVQYCGVLSYSAVGKVDRTSETTCSLLYAVWKGEMGEGREKNGVTLRTCNDFHPNPKSKHLLPSPTLTFVSAYCGPPRRARLRKTRWDE